MEDKAQIPRLEVKEMIAKLDQKLPPLARDVFWAKFAQYLAQEPKPGESNDQLN